MAARSASPGSTVSPASLVTVAARPRPFHLNRTILHFPFGLTLAEIVARVLPEPELAALAVVTVRGEQIPREFWPRLRPKPGHTLEIVVVPQGGQGGRIALVAAVTILAIVASVVTYGLATPYVAAGTISAYTAAGLAAAAGAAVSIAGTLAINALVPPEPLQLEQNKTRTSATYSIGGGQNTARFKEPVKKILGQHRVYPDLAGPWYTEQVGDDQYLRGLLDVGYAPLVIAEIKIGEVPIGEYEDADFEILDGSGTAVQTSPLYPGNVVQDPVTAALTKVGGAVTRTTRRETDEWSADLAFPRGLIAYGHNTGDALGQDVQVQVRYRTAQDGNIPAGSWSSPATYTAHGKTGSPIRRTIGDVFPARGQYDLELTRLTDDHDPADVGASGSPHHLDECSWESLRSLNHDAPVTLPGIVRIAIKIRSSRQLSGTIDKINCIATSVMPAWDPVSGTWVADTANGTRNPAALFRDILQGAGQPLPVPDDQVDLATLEYWSELCAANGWTCDFVMDRDMSTLELLRVVAGCGRASPMQPDAIWSVAIDEPKTVCVQYITPRNLKGFRWRRIFARQPHALRTTFVDRTNGYANDSERIVYQDGYDATNATEFLDWEMPGCTDPDLIHRHGRKRLAEIRLRPETFELDVDWEGLVNTRGDWIRAAHDTVEIGSAWGRVKSVETSGGQVTALTLDDAVVLDGSASYVARVRTPSGQSWLADIVGFSGEQYRLELLHPADLLSDGPAVGDLAIIGIKGQETEDLLVIGVRRGRNHTATITAVPLAPAVHTAEIGPIPPWAPKLTSPAGTVAPIIWSLTDDSTALHRDADGSYRLAIVASLWRDGSAPLDRYAALQVEWVEVGTGRPSQSREWPADAQEARLDDVALGETYEVRARYRIREALGGGYSVWSGVKTHFLDGPQLPPPDPGVPYLAGDRIVWSYPTPPPDFAGFSVRYTSAEGQGWDQAQPVTDGLYTLPYVLLDELSSSAVEVLIRAEDTTGNLSNGTSRISVVGVPRPELVEVAAEDYVAEGFPGDLLVPEPIEWIDTATGQVIEWLDTASGGQTIAWTGGSGRAGGEIVGGVLRGTDTSAWLDPPEGAWLAPQDGAWLQGTFGGFTYVFRFTVPALARSTDELKLEIVSQGDIYVVFRSVTDALIRYAGDDAIPAGAAVLPPGWVPFGALLGGVGSASEIHPWRDGLRPVVGDTLELTLFGRGGAVRAEVSGLRMVLESPLFTRVFGDFPIAAGGSQAALPADYRGVDWVHATLHQPSQAALAGLLNKQAVGGPTLIAYDQNRQTVGAVAEVTVGYY